MDRRHVVAVAQGGRGPDRDRFVPVAGIQRAEQIAALVHRDHSVLDRPGQNHHLVDMDEQLRVAGGQRVIG